jgi:hypothetical protein
VNPIPLSPSDALQFHARYAPRPGQSEKLNSKIRPSFFLPAARAMKHTMPVFHRCVPRVSGWKSSGTGEPQAGSALYSLPVASDNAAAILLARMSLHYYD